MLFLTVLFASSITDSRNSSPPFFLFGDFNFRLDTRSLVQVLNNLFLCKLSWCVSAWHFDIYPSLCLCFCEQHLSTSANVQRVKKDSSNEVEKIICKEKDNDHQVVILALIIILFCTAAFTLLAFMSHTGAAPNWGEAVCLSAPGSFQGGQRQSSENTQTQL